MKAPSERRPIEVGVARSSAWLQILDRRRIQWDSALSGINPPEGRPLPLS